MNATEVTLEALLKPDLAEYAQLLRDNGFTIYVYDDPEWHLRGDIARQTWFHYSRIVGEQVCYGYFQQSGPLGTDTRHSMPTLPSTQYGSGIVVDAPWQRDAWSVEAAREVARPSNVGKWVNARLQNYKPWPIRGHNDRVQVIIFEATP